ncbi:hypothetical protein SAMN05421770_101735 [Granulicella rosea]|uniref:CAAX prenyl protease 2/Lysostaphin resistance protein A-like domain-containing protein n=1 Tax=Granulicella rosea TaxID=474952 RepID=A0A239E0C9_9BACT|nr:CPBP family intramembrane glutamic endopeptidase [Granulicella rosea]SNS37969.1 hypothetical protein SAMN05421770_101735 [Granulicella rosea]
MYSESPQPRKHPLHNLFIGDDGLRAGWSVLLFFAFVAGFATLWHMLVRQLHLMRGMGAHAPMTWTRVLLTDGGNFAIFALAAWLMSLIERRRFGIYGLSARRWLGDFLAGLAWGLAALSLLIGCLFATHLLAFDGVSLHGANAVGLGAKWLLAFLLVGFFEEFLTRGYIQYTAARGIRRLVLRVAPDSPHADTIAFWITAILLSAALFMYLHTGNPGETFIGILAVGVAGLTFVFSLWRTGTLWWAIGFHAAWDWAQSYLYGVADSGGMVAGHLLNTHPTGSPLLSGGTTGPEGSIFVIPTLALVCLAIHITLPRRGGAGIYTQQ